MRRDELHERDTRGESRLRHAPIEFEAALLEADPRLRAIAGVAALEAFETAPQPWAIRRVCSREFRAVRDSGERMLSAIELLVVHCTQGFTARSAASWFANDDSRGSAHVCVDGNECYRTLPPSRIPWGARGVNTAGWHLEIAGFAEWSRAQWRARDRLLRRAGWKLAVHSLAFDVELRLLSRAQLRAGQRGVITHRMASDVFGGTHTDPGVGFPMSDLLEYARTYKGELQKARRS